MVLSGIQCTTTNYNPVRGVKFVVAVAVVIAIIVGLVEDTVAPVVGSTTDHNE